jgi:hypothetical protein
MNGAPTVPQVPESLTTFLVFGELAASIALLPIAIWLSRHHRRLDQRWWLSMRRWTSRPWVGPVLVGSVALLVQVIAAMVLELPTPQVHDEFAFLLGADTFAHGRLTNPTHPLWEHFESFHIIQQPTYQMKFPPGHSLAMAVGTCLGEPVIGVWLSLALGCAAVTWMLQGWVSPRWAIVGGLWMALQYRLALGWGQGFWGGQVAMLGGALLLGALPRLLRQPSARSAVVFALGLVVLALTRPYEGLLVSLPTCIGLLIGWKKRALLSLGLLRQVLPPMLAVLIPATLWSLYYNYRVTGDPLCMPYQAWQRTYAPYQSITQTMFSLKLGGTNKTRRVIPLPKVDELTTRQSRAAVAKTLTPRMKLLSQWWFYFGFVGTLPLAASLTLRSRKTFFAGAMVGMIMGAILLMSARAQSNYSAPVACLTALLVVMGWRRIAVMSFKGQRLGVGGIYATGLLLIALLGGVLVANWGSFRGPIGHYRPQIIDYLQTKGGGHLVLVHYRPNHLVQHEWVYNTAQIDDAPVVWARELSPRQNQKLLDYFADRQVWVLDADAAPPALRPYRKPEASPPAQTDDPPTSADLH